MGNELIKILYIDDEKAALFNFEQLYNDDFEVYTAISASAGLDILVSTDIQIIIADQRMPDKTGIEFLAEVALLYPDTVRILLTAYSEASIIIDAINRGQVYQYITKPFETQNVKNILDKAAQNLRLNKDNKALIVELKSKNEEYVAINEELRQTNKDLFDGSKKIEELVERLSLSQKVSSAGTWDWDIQNNNFYWSAEFLLIFGMEPDTVPGFESWTKSLHPDDIELATKKILDAIAQKTDLLQHYRIVLPDGNLRWIMSTGKTTYQNDIPIRMIGLCMNITQQKQAEDKVIASQAELKKAQEIAHIGSWHLDLATNQVVWSEELYKMYGFDPTLSPPLLNESSTLFTPESWELLSTSIAKTGETGIPYEIELKIVRKDGSNGWMWALGEAVLDKDGKIVGLRGAIQDITERKRIEDKILDSQVELKKSLILSNQSRQTLLSVLEDQQEVEKEIHKLNKELEQRVIERTAQFEASNKELEAFSYSVSHDLRAPLRHINGFAELLTRQYSAELSEDARKHLNTIIASAHKMGTLIDDLLSFSRTGRAELKKSSLSMEQVVRDAVTQIAPALKDRKIDWKISPLPVVNGDYNLLRLAWGNLLDNAVKYTTPKNIAKINIGYKVDNNMFVFHISDNGVGFDMKYSKKLFGVFQRLHSTSQFEGTGIGLANVRRIIVRHGGNTWAEAEPGKGATFFFSLPKYQEKNEQPPAI